MSGHIGAEIFGVDLTRRSNTETVAEVRAALLQWKVVFFRDQHLTQEQHLAFARQFGEPTPAHPTLPAVFPEFPEILLLDNQVFAKREKADDKPSGKLAQVAGAPSREPVAHRRHVRAQPADGRRSCAASSFRRTAATRNGPTSSSPTKRCPRRCSGCRRACTPCTTTNCRCPRRDGRRLEKQFQSRTSVRCTRSCACIRRRAKRRCSSTPISPATSSSSPAQEGRHLLAMLYEHMTNPEFTCVSAGSPAASRSGTTGRPPPRPHRRAAGESTARCSASPCR